MRFSQRVLEEKPEKSQKNDEIKIAKNKKKSQKVLLLENKNLLEWKKIRSSSQRKSKTCTQGSAQGSRFHNIPIPIPGCTS